MSFDLWADEPLEEVVQEARARLAQAPTDSVDPLGEDFLDLKPTFDLAANIPSEGHLALKIHGKTIVIYSKVDLRRKTDFAGCLSAEVERHPEGFLIQMPLRPLNAWTLRHLLKNAEMTIDPEDGAVLRGEANKVPKPTVELAPSGKHLDVTAPAAPVYREILRSLDARPLNQGVFRLQMTKLLDLQTLDGAMKTDLPHFAYSEEVIALTAEPIPGYDGTMDSLKSISVGELNMVKADAQSFVARKKSGKSLLEKLESVGIVTLFDLLHRLPRRYIDKSSPQELRDLLPDETATIIGVVESSNELGGGSGVNFTIRTEGGSSIRVTFWRQLWLRQKYTVGSEVLITGKLGFFRGQPQLNGTSIEFAQEAAILPIVPVYKQSETKGITTALLLSAVRELFARIQGIRLPEYFQGEGRVPYGEIYREIHIPSTLQHHEQMLNSLAYYELIYMQLLIQEQKELAEDRPGITQEPSKKDLQALAISLLPFTLTNAQKKGVSELNEKLARPTPSSTLLNADVGAGKTLVAQMACLRAVDAGYQAVLMAPTDVLATQLYEGFLRVAKTLENAGEEVRVVYLGGTTKGAERRALVKAIKEGEAHVIVGTHAVMAASVKYKNLGFVGIDEQQKFGAAQRTALLESREDGRIPDLLMQTATPIPRSVAQVFYGDIDMILMDEKPPGRLPIITEWIEEDPLELLEKPISSMWDDIAREAAQGNQTFVITPLVRDSLTVDSASVERAYEMLRDRIFPNLRVGYVHGAMKADALAETMARFRAQEYDVLVASTVVEVGVDIPNATRVVVLSADRLGASSLHQIRGRAGRNSKQSRCYLVSLGKTEDSRHRLQSLVDSENGFDVAKADLKNRGEGTIFSSNQSGAGEMLFASLRRHGKLVPRATAEALDILKSPLREAALRDAHDMFDREGRLM